MLHWFFFKYLNKLQSDLDMEKGDNSSSGTPTLIGIIHGPVYPGVGHRLGYTVLLIPGWVVGSVSCPI